MWKKLYAKAVKSLKSDLEDPLSFFMLDDPSWKKITKTTNAIERKSREVRRRTRPP